MRMRPCVLAGMWLLSVAGSADAQVFTRITTAGPAVTDAVQNLGGTWVDYNQDGFLDLYVIGDACDMYVNDGAGGFTEVATGDFVENPFGYFYCIGVWGDVDNDGYPDLYRANIGIDDGQLNILSPGPDDLYRNSGPPFYSMVPVALPPDSTESTAVSYVDYDRDGDLDIYVCADSGYDLFYRNEGGLSFSRLTTPAMIDSSIVPSNDYWIDIDQDGDDDVYTVNQGAPNTFYRNELVETGSPTFTAVVSPITTENMGSDIDATFGDYDNDSDFDLFVSTILNRRDLLFRNDGGAFVRIRGTALTEDIHSVAFSQWVDVDNDADLDLFLGLWAFNGVSPLLFTNDGTGALTEDDGSTHGDLYDVIQGIQSGEFADYDNDGDLDLYVTNFAHPHTPTGAPHPNDLYRNEGTGNHWIRLRFEGTTSNRDAVGTHLRLVATVGGVPIRQLRYVSGSQSGNLSQQDKRVHVGLGDATLVDSLVVTWPSGLVEILTDIPADQDLHIVEGATVGLDETSVPVTRLFRAPSPLRLGDNVTLLLGEADRVTVDVFDARGRRVRRLLDDVRVSGDHTLPFDGRDQWGNAISPGVLFLRVTTRTQRVVEKRVFVR